MSYPATRTFVADIFNGHDRSYLYFWVSKQARFVYVGQTAERTGTYGRGYGHLQAGGTLRHRVEEATGYALERFDDLLLISYRLPETAEYVGLESSYREAVEYLVHTRLLDERGNYSPPFRVISTIRTNERTEQNVVRQLAEHIAQDFLRNY